jgi:hypothetical protein
MEDLTSEDVEGQMRFLITVNERHIVGHLFFEIEKRLWSFRYSSSFKNERFLPIGGLPDLEKIYDNQETVKWLTDRMYDKAEIDPMRFRIREHVKNKDNKFIAYFLEVSHVH